MMKANISRHVCSLSTAITRRSSPANWGMPSSGDCVLPCLFSESALMTVQQCNGEPGKEVAVASERLATGDEGIGPEPLP